MLTRQKLAMLLVAFGAIALLSMWLPSALWLWMALLAGGLLVAYAQQPSYPLLIAGSILSGIAIGILLEFSLGLPGAFFMSLAVGFIVIYRLGAKQRWALYMAAATLAFGVFYGLTELGILGSWWFAVILIIAGVMLLLSRAKSSDSWQTPAAAPPPQPQTLSDEALRAALERWRAAVAQRENRQPHLILTNDTLEQIINERPATLEALANVKGVGPVKLERYGADILKIVAGNTQDAAQSGVR